MSAVFRACAMLYGWTPEQTGRLTMSQLCDLMREAREAPAGQYSGTGRPFPGVPGVTIVENRWPGRVSRRGR